MAKEHSGVRTARSGIVYVLGQSLGSIAVLVTLAILARLLSPNSWGLYSIVIAFYTFFGMLGNFSIGTAVRKKMVEQRDARAKRNLLSNAYRVSLIISLFIALCGVIASGYAANSIYQQPSLMLPLMFASILIVFWAVFNLTLASLVAVGEVAKAASINIVYSFVQLVAAPALVLLGYGIVGAIAGLAIGIVAGTLLGLFFILRKMGRLSWKTDEKQVKSIVGFATPVYASYLAMQGIFSFAILFLGGYVSATIVGNYNIGYELGGFVSIILTTSMFILLPAFSSIASLKRSRDRIGPSLNRSIYYTLLFLAPMVAYICAASKPIVFLLFSQKYIYAPLYFPIVAVGLTLGIIWNYASTMMLGMGDVRRFLKYQIASAVFELLLVALLTPAFKVAGMLVGLFIIFPIVMDIAYILEFRRSVGYRPELRKAALVALASVVVFMVMYLTSRVFANGYAAIVADLLVALVLYPPLVAVVGGIVKPDIAFLRKTLGARAAARPLMLLVDYTERFVRR